MLELLNTQAFTVGALSFRWLLQIVLLSLGLTLACRWAFRDDSRSRRSLCVAAIWLLALVPVLLVVWQPRYQIGLVNPPLMPELATVPALLLALWAIAATIGCAMLVVQVVQARRQLRSLSALNNSDTRAIADGFSERLGLSVPQLVVGERCCASSMGKPTLVIPEGFASWPLTAQRSVIAHELVHLQRRDDLFMVALQLIARCYLFCPWLRSLYQRFVHALEEACDERAAELVGQRALYLEGLAEAALLDGGNDYERNAELVSSTAATRTIEGQAVVATLINAEHQHSFMQRLARLLGQQRFFEVQSGAIAAGMGIGLILLGIVTTFEFVAVPQRYVLSASPVPVATRLSITPASQSEQDRSAIEQTGVDHEVQVIVRFPKTMQPRKELVTPAVIYPGRALLNAVEGEVLMEFAIAADGSTVRPRVLHSTHPRYFNRAATRAVRQAVFAPLHNDGFSGVKTADLTRAGALLAVRNGRATSDRKVQKLFLFRLRT